MTKKLKDLYKATTLTELNCQADIAMEVSLPANRLVVSLEKVNNEAHLKDAECDEELAYIMFMRTVRLCLAMKKSRGYEPVMFDHKINAISKHALERAEKLSESLKRRYELLQDEKRAAQKEKFAEEAKFKEDVARAVPAVNGVVDGPPDIAAIDADISPSRSPDSALPSLSNVNCKTISCRAVSYLVKQREDTFLILDCRPKEDFLCSHILHEWVINVPADEVKTGMTAHAIQQIIPQPMKDSWLKRRDVQSLVFLDWGSDPPANPIQPKLTALLKALEVDRMVVPYRSEFLILQGGYETWLANYPDLTTNSGAKRPLSSSSISFSIENDASTHASKIATPSSSGYSSTMKTNCDAVTDIESSNVSVTDGGDDKKRANSFYPKLESFSLRLKPKNAEPRDNADTSALEEIDVGFHRRRGHHASHLPFASAVPEVNRATKPSFSLFRKKDKDGSKASLNSDKSGSSSASLTSMESTLSAEVDRLSVGHNASVAPAVPVVNRDTKPAELLRSFATAKSNAHKLEEAYVDEMRSLKDKEEEWAKLAMEKRFASEESMRLLLQKREEQLLEELSASEKQKEKLSRDFENAQKEIAALRAAVQASKEATSVDSSSAFSSSSPGSLIITDAERRRAEEKRILDAEVAKLRELRRESERRRKQELLDMIQRNEAEQRKIKEAKELEDLRKEQLRIEESKRRAQEAEQARIVAELADKRRKEEQAERDRARIAEQERQERPKRPVYHEPLKDSGMGSGGLSRSHSSPNIDQLGTSDDRSAPSTPAVDRQVKKYSFQQDQFLSRPRDFAAVHGSTPPGRTGLKNLGNTCYMNATIQCLGNAPFLTQYFLDQLFLDDLNPNCETKGEIARELYLVFRALWAGSFRHISIIDLKKLVGKYYPPFSGHDQQDCHEFLVVLLGWLRDDLNKVKRKPKTNVSVDIDRIQDDLEAARTAWNMLVEAEKSIFVESFGGLQKSTLYCKNCGDSSRTFEPVFELSLPLPSKNRCTLEDCIREYLNGECLSDRQCPKCRKKGYTLKKFHIWRFPHILVIHLKRFERHTGKLDKKLQNYVDFPLENLDLEVFVNAPPGSNVPTSTSPTLFDLFAVTNHYGTMDGGHYTAYCKNRGMTWCKYDDQAVREMSPSDVKSSAAYVLYFAAKNLMKQARFPSL